MSWDSKSPFPGFPPSRDDDTAWRIPDALRTIEEQMAKCDEGYRCEVCGGDVEEITESDLYLRYVIGMVDPETLHTTQERHLGCNPALAQFIVDPDFPPVTCQGDFDKRHLDTNFVTEREKLVTRGWRRLKEVASSNLTIQEYPLPEIYRKMKQQAERE